MQIIGQDRWLSTTQNPNLDRRTRHHTETEYLARRTGNHTEIKSQLANSYKYTQIYNHYTQNPISTLLGHYMKVTPYKPSGERRMQPTAEQEGIHTLHLHIATNPVHP